MVAETKIAEHVINIDNPIISTIEEVNCSSLQFQGGIYEPNILSIGPYHNGKLATQTMQIMKYECLDYILKMNPDKKIDDYMTAIRAMENQIRKFYGDEIKMDRNRFLKLLLLDGCFLILTLLGVEGISQKMTSTGIRMEKDENKCETIIDMEVLEAHENQHNIDEVNKDDFYHIRVWYTDLFSTDILLLQNQIPFFVITKIYEMAKGSNNTTFLIETIAKFVEVMIECYPTSITILNRPKDFHHLLHLCHMYFRPSERSIENKIPLDRELGHWHQATEYRKAGIRFKKREFRNDDPHSLLDIGFHDGMMEIPCLTIDDNTRCLFSNLIAFEHTCPQVGNDVTAYVVFWSQFIKTSNDVALLVKNGIIVHQLNSDAEVSDIFAELAKGAYFDINGDCYLNYTYYKLESHYRSNKTRLMTWLGSIASYLYRWVK